MQSSSVSRGRSGGFGIGLSTKMQKKGNTTFLALLKQSFALESTKQVFKASFETCV